MPTVLCHVFLACFYSNFEYYLQNFGISNTEGAIRLHGVDFSLTWGLLAHFAANIKRILCVIL